MQAFRGKTRSAGDTQSARRRARQATQAERVACVVNAYLGAFVQCVSPNLVLRLADFYFFSWRFSAKPVPKKAPNANVVKNVESGSGTSCTSTVKSSGTCLYPNSS